MSVWEQQLKWCKDRLIPFMQLCGYEVDAKEVNKFSENFDEMLRYREQNSIGTSIWYGWKNSKLPFCHGVLLYALSYKVSITTMRSYWPERVYKNKIDGVSFYTYRDLLVDLDTTQIIPIGTEGVVESKSDFNDDIEVRRYDGRLMRYVWWSMLPAFEVAPNVGQPNFNRLTYLYFTIPENKSTTDQCYTTKFIPKEK